MCLPARLGTTKEKFAKDAFPLNVASREAPPNRGSPAPQQPSAPPAGEYYEDVDPRFAEAPPPLVVRSTTPPPIQTTNTYESEDIPQGARSPAESERSTFTSISQRGINPRWNPPPPPPGWAVTGLTSSLEGPSIGRLTSCSTPTQTLSYQRGGGTRAQGGMIPGSAYPAL